MNANDLAACVVNQSHAVAKLKWFTFRQNNSGGSFTVNNDVDTNVIVQAHNADEANELAQRVGIYFSGVADGIDCECCGDRWSTIWSNDEGTDVPSIYGHPVDWQHAVKPSKSHGLPNGVKVYPYDIISKR
jgi:hypothetical protein